MIHLLCRHTDNSSIKQLVYYVNVENIFAFSLNSDHNMCVIYHDVVGGCYRRDDAHYMQK